MSNQERAEEFANCFDPPLAVCKTERINNVPVKDAYCAAGMVCDGKVGVQAMVFGNGHLKAYVEFVGSREFAAEVGQKFAKLAEIWDAEQQS
jgi:myo-inositol catabolism protein IolC